MERTIAENCGAGNTHNAVCVKVGIDIPDLDIKSGDNLDWVLQQLGIQSTTGSEEISVPDTINANLHCLGGSGNSVCASKILVRNLVYNLKPGSSGTTLFSWDLSSIRGSLAADYSVLSISVVANSGSSTSALLNSSSAKASVTFYTTNYPITVDIRMRINTPCGQIELSKTISLFNPSDSGNKVVIMELNDFTSSTIQDLTQDEYNELIACEICIIKDRVTLLEENTDFTEQISDIDNRVVALETVTILGTEISKINCTGDTVVTSIENFLTDLQKRLCAVEST